MTKRDKIIYWAATLWLALGMTSTGVVQIIGMKDEVTRIGLLGYPPSFITLMGVWKILGVVAILVPRFPLLKEWAYAGFFFNMSGALYSHVVSGSQPADFFGPSLLLVLTVVSWYFRPGERKLAFASA